MDLALHVHGRAYWQGTLRCEVVDEQGPTLAWPILAVRWQRRMGGEPEPTRWAPIEAPVVDNNGGDSPRPICPDAGLPIAVSGACMPGEGESMSLTESLTPPHASLTERQPMRFRQPQVAALVILNSESVSKTIWATQDLFNTARTRGA